MTMYFAPVLRRISADAGVVVEVGVADEQDLDVAEVEAELRDAFLDQRRRGCQAGVDQDVAGRRDDEIGGEVLAADVVEVVGDAEGCDRGGPVGREPGP